MLPGDVIVLYTDGITEAMNGDGDLFGDAALGRILGSGTRHDAGGIRERVVREVNTFVGDAEPHDDMTMVVIKIHDASMRGRSKSSRSHSSIETEVVRGLLDAHGIEASVSSALSPSAVPRAVRPDGFRVSVPATRPARPAI